jgi:hypothetical protein
LVLRLRAIQRADGRAHLAHRSLGRHVGSASASIGTSSRFSGLGVTIVEPGPTATSFIPNIQVAAPIADYDQTVREARKAISALPASVFNSADRVADAILAAVDAEHPPRRLATGSFSVNAMRAALHARLEELDAVASLSESVDAPVAA